MLSCLVRLSCTALVVPAGAAASGRLAACTNCAVPDSNTNHSSTDRIVINSYGHNVMRYIDGTQTCRWSNSLVRASPYPIYRYELLGDKTSWISYATENIVTGYHDTDLIDRTINYTNCNLHPETLWFEIRQLAVLSLQPTKTVYFLHLQSDCRSQ